MNNTDQEQEPSTALSNYFAALPPDDLLSALSEKINDYYEFATRYQFMDKWRRGYQAYYGMSDSGATSSKMNYGGTNGDDIILKVNQYRSLLQNLLTMTTSSRPAWSPKAQNTDSKSLNQAVLARSILDYYFYEMKLTEKLKQATEFALFAAEGFIALSWNATTGNIVTVSENGAPIYDGDLHFQVFHPIDVIRDPNSADTDSHWKVLREFKNKYDLIAKFPELEDEIMSYQGKIDSTNSYVVYDSQKKSDLIPVYTFMHKETEALPQGRYVEFLDGITVLVDSPLPYKDIPVFRIASGDWAGTCFGYTTGYDLLGIQKAYDALQSIIATNLINLGVVNILVPRASNIEASQLGQGMNYLEYDHAGGIPTVLDLAKSSPEIFQEVDRLQNTMQTLSGVNAVSRGNVDKEMSGAALALIASQAVTFNSGLQNSYNSLLEAVGQGIIQILQMYCQTPRIAAIGGKSNRSRVQEFKGEDLAGIQRVIVEAVNPLSKTAAGRMQMAQDMLNSKLITTPQHYLEVIETGNLEALLEHDTSEILLVRSENEDLADGKEVTALSIDMHKTHILEHKTVLASPEARADPKITQAVLAHIQQHLDLNRSTDPALLQLLGEQPLPPKAPPPGPSAPPQGTPGPAIPAMANPTQPVVTEAQGVKGPHMPSLPKGTPPDLQNAYSQVKTNS